MFYLSFALTYAGMSESSGPHSLNLFAPGRWSVGSAGKNMDGVRTKLDQPDEDGEGEVSIHTVPIRLDQPK